MARRRKNTSRKKSSSRFWPKLLFFLLLLIFGFGFGIWKYPTTARQWVAVIVEKVRPARQNPLREPQPEPTVTQTSTIPQEIRFPDKQVEKFLRGGYSTLHSGRAKIRRGISICYRIDKDHISSGANDHPEQRAGNSFR